MTDERPLVEGIDAYHESLREGARRERNRILKLIDEKIQRYKNISFNDTVIKRGCLEELKEELKEK
jgi:predicted HTH domain antitoxin